MVDINAEAKNAYFADNMQKEIKITFPNGEHAVLDNSKIVANSFSYTESLCSQDNLKFGLCESNVLNVTVECEDNIKGCEIAVTMKIYYNYKSNTMNIGHFKVDSCKRIAGTKLREIIAYSIDFNKSLNYPFFINEKMATVYSTAEREAIPLNTLLYMCADKTDVNDEDLTAAYITPLNSTDYEKTYDTCTNQTMSYQFKGRIIKSIIVKTQEIAPERVARGHITKYENYKDYGTHNYTDNRNISGYYDMPKELATYFTGIDGRASDYYIWSASENMLISLPQADVNKLKSYIYNPFVKTSSDSTGHPYITYEYDHEKYIPANQYKFVKSISITLQDEHVSGSATFHTIIINISDVGSFRTYYVKNSVNIDYLFLNRIETEEGSGKYIIKPLAESVDLLKGYYESKGKFIYCKRDGNVSLKTINNNFALYPEDIIYPDDEIYPVVASSNYQPITTTSYKAANYEEYSCKKYGFVRVSYLSSDNEPYSITVACDPKYKNVYDMTSNAFFLESGKIWSAEQVGQYIKEKFYPNVKDITYNPADVKIKGLPFLEAGDVIKVNADLGAFKTFVFRRTMTGEQSLTDNITANGEEENENAKAWREVVGIIEGA